MCGTELKWHGRYQTDVAEEKVRVVAEAFMKGLKLSAYEFIENSNVRFDTVSLLYRPSENCYQFIYRKISSKTVCRNSVSVKYVVASQDKEFGIGVFIRIRISEYMKPLVQDAIKGFIKKHSVTFFENIGVKKYE